MTEQQTITIQQGIDLAVQHHNAGDLTKAENIYQQILRAEPNQPVALHLLGMIAHQVGKNDIAVDLINKALAIKPDYAEANFNLGNVLKELGKFDEAVTSYNKALVINPDFAEVHFYLGNVLKELGKFEEAVTSYEKALAIKPDYAAAHSNRGNVLKELGKLDEAAASYDKALAIEPDYAEPHYNLATVLNEQRRFDEAAASYNKALAIKPDFAEAHNNLGNTLKNLGKYDEAVASYNMAIHIKPDFAEAHSNLGSVLKDLGKLDEAVTSYDKALAIKPDYAEAHSNLGNVLNDLGKLDEAVASCNKALVIKPHYAEAHNNLGNTLKNLGKLDEAVTSYDKALAIKPDYAEAHSNLGVALNYQGKLDEAVASYNQALAIKPDHAEAHNNLGLSLLLDGDFLHGFEGYEWRWKVDNVELNWRNWPYPIWDGSSLNGKRILVWREQGLGDEIVFASLYSELITRGAKCIFECEPRLVGLFQRSFPTAVVIACGETPLSQTFDPTIDFHCPAGSLTKWLLPSFDKGPSRENYLHPDLDMVATLKSRYQAGPEQKLIGLGWWTQHPKLQKRYNIPEGFFDSLLKTPDVQFVNLQYGDHSAEIDAIKRRTGVTILQDEEIDPLMNMDAFSAQEASMDLVISIVNSTAVLASGLGTPVWGLLPKFSEWRWGNEKDQCLWYPSMRLFRQSNIGDWSGVSKKITTAFQHWAKIP